MHIHETGSTCARHHDFGWKWDYLFCDLYHDLLGARINKRICVCKFVNNISSSDWTVKVNFTASRKWERLINVGWRDLKINYGSLSLTAWWNELNLNIQTKPTGSSKINKILTVQWNIPEMPYFHSYYWPRFNPVSDPESKFPNIPK